jgi:hypothetical protein
MIRSGLTFGGDFGSLCRDHRAIPNRIDLSVGVDADFHRLRMIVNNDMAIKPRPLGHQLIAPGLSQKEFGI